MTNPLRLEQYFFPHQEVRANPGHDPAGKLDGTNTTTKTNISRIPDRSDAVIAECVLSLDETTSENPIYFFTLHVFGIFVAPEGMPEDVMMQSAPRTAIPILIGAARERLAELTARAPWGTLFLNTVPIQIQSGVVGDTPEP
ncbi:MAG: hypothetical protein IDH49_09645 [Gammaproteobacteria bacterium]|nr:hypothetical protein [Gammaproteobacteria bacterium]